MNATFEITVYIYQNHKKIAEIKENREVTGAKEVFLKRDKIEFTFPYTPPAKGKYYFDIIVKDVFSNARYRNLIQYKF
ncbi:MAG: hypothetical protein GY950_17760 [bacterium]|nr:hypothetical protein [bacterium]